MWWLPSSVLLASLATWAASTWPLFSKLGLEDIVVLGVTDVGGNGKALYLYQGTLKKDVNVRDQRCAWEIKSRGKEGNSEIPTEPNKTVCGTAEGDSGKLTHSLFYCSEGCLKGMSCRQTLSRILPASCRTRLKTHRR